jgi:hypothetical protein
VEELEMLRTITIGNYMSIQGVFVKMLQDGLMVVQVGANTYTGRPVN